jgi:hypothetical protein
MALRRALMISLALFCALPGLLACRQNPLVKRANPPPRADASATQTEYPQAPATVMLDGSRSSDDGKVTQWHWLSATKDPDGKPGRYVPPDVPEAQRAGWPPDGQTSSVQLPRGIWKFSLWVTDDQGVTGDPATVEIFVGNPDRETGGAGGSSPAAGGGGMGGAAGSGAGAGGG